jgi:hypothetical protein
LKIGLTPGASVGGHSGHSSHSGQNRAVQGVPDPADKRRTSIVCHAERNPVRAKPIPWAEDRPRSSLRPGDPGPALDPGPVPRGADWSEFAKPPMTEAELAAIRLSLRRNRPHVVGSWVAEAAALMGLEYSLRPNGHQPGTPAKE